MNILIIGAGGREHAFAWKIKQSNLCNKLFIAPGNAGTALCGKNLPIGVNDFEAIKQACTTNNIQLILIGPEEPLVNGIYDFFKNNAATKHIAIIAPSKAAAQLEGSKSFAKKFMFRHNVPTAAYKEFTINNFDEGIAYLKNHSLPIVLKADGLAAGKGVLICETIESAVKEFDLMLHQNKFGNASKTVVVEEFLNGIELSIFILTDGKNYLLLPEAKDYKRIGIGDTGLNTGGMGAVSPLPFVDEIFLQKVKQKIIEPTIAGFKKDNLDYKGFVFFGLMNNNGEPKVIEYNCRMGDPETEAVIPRIKNDLVELLIATAQQKLSQATIEIDNRSTVAIVAVSGGYPGNYVTEKTISGLNNINDTDSLVFQSGTKQINNDIVTNGGRVLVITAYADTIAQAAAKATQNFKHIHFDNMNFRKDIGYEFV